MPPLGSCTLVAVAQANGEWNALDHVETLAERSLRDIRDGETENPAN